MTPHPHGRGPVQCECPGAGPTPGLDEPAAGVRRRLVWHWTARCGLVQVERPLTPAGSRATSVILARRNRGPLPWRRRELP